MLNLKLYSVVNTKLIFFQMFSLQDQSMHLYITTIIFAYTRIGVHMYGNIRNFDGYFPSPCRTSSNIVVTCSNTVVFYQVLQYYLLLVKLVKK